MSRTLEAAADICYWSAGAGEEQWWNPGINGWDDGPQPGDSVYLNDKEIHIDVSINLSNYTIASGSANIIVEYGCTVYSAGIDIRLNYGTVHLTGATVNTMWGDVYLYSADANVFDYGSGNIYIATPNGGSVFGAPIRIPAPEDIVAGNIKSGVTILGVTGNLTPGGGVIRIGD